MPFIKIQTNYKISEKQEYRLKECFGKAIERIPGKSEMNLLLKLETDCHLWLRGQNEEGIVYIEASVFGNEDHYHFDLFTKEVTEGIHQILHVPEENIYIKYDDIGAFGVLGKYIDRRFF